MNDPLNELKELIDPLINYIDRDIYRKVRDGELEEKATCRKFRQVRTEDKLR